MAEWAAEIQVKVDGKVQQELAHLPEVVAQLAQIATEVAGAAGAGHTPGSFGIRVQNDPGTRRARALAHPTSNGGIHLQLSQHVLEKAAASHGTKTISAKASSGATSMGNQREAAATVTGTTITPISASQIPEAVR